MFSSQKPGPIDMIEDRSPSLESQVKEANTYAEKFV
jgi:hypothetical protein